MKKLIALSIILTLSVSLLSGCGTKQSKIQQTQTQQQVQEDDDEEMSWFEDEVLDMDDWGESSHKKKVKPKTDTKSKAKSSTKSSTSKKK